MAPRLHPLAAQAAAALRRRLAHPEPLDKAMLAGTGELVLEISVVAMLIHLEGAGALGR